MYIRIVSPEIFKGVGIERDVVVDFTEIEPRMVKNNVFNNRVVRNCFLKYIVKMNTTE